MNQLVVILFSIIFCCFPVYSFDKGTLVSSRKKLERFYVNPIQVKIKHLENRYFALKTLYTHLSQFKNKFRSVYSVVDSPLAKLNKIEYDPLIKDFFNITFTGGSVNKRYNINIDKLASGFVIKSHRLNDSTIYSFDRSLEFKFNNKRLSCLLRKGEKLTVLYKCIKELGNSNNFDVKLEQDLGYSTIYISSNISSTNIDKIVFNGDTRFAFEIGFLKLDSSNNNKLNTLKSKKDVSLSNLNKLDSNKVNLNNIDCLDKYKKNNILGSYFFNKVTNSLDIYPQSIISFCSNLEYKFSSLNIEGFFSKLTKENNEFQESSNLRMLINDSYLYTNPIFKLYHYSKSYINKILKIKDLYYNKDFYISCDLNNLKLYHSLGSKFSYDEKFSYSNVFKEHKLNTGFNSLYIVNKSLQSTLSIKKIECVKGLLNERGNTNSSVNSDLNNNNIKDLDKSKKSQYIINYVQKAQNASIEVDGIKYYSYNNIFNNVAKGLSIKIFKNNVKGYFIVKYDINKLKTFLNLIKTHYNSIILYISNISSGDNYSEDIQKHLNNFNIDDFKLLDKIFLSYSMEEQDLLSISGKKFKGVMYGSSFLRLLFDRIVNWIILPLKNPKKDTKIKLFKQIGLEFISNKNAGVSDLDFEGIKKSKMLIDLNTSNLGNLIDNNYKDFCDFFSYSSTGKLDDFHGKAIDIVNLINYYIKGDLKSKNTLAKQGIIAFHIQNIKLAIAAQKIKLIDAKNMVDSKLKKLKTQFDKISRIQREFESNKTNMNSMLRSGK